MRPVQDSAGAEIKVALLLDESTLLLYGWTIHALPRSGRVCFEGETEGSGIYEAATWARPEVGGESETTWFLIVLRFDNIAQVRARWLSLRSHDGAVEFPLPDVPRIQMEPAGLFQAMKPEMSENAGVVLQFLRRTLIQSQFAKPSPRAVRFLFAFLHAMAQPDGFVELFGRLQGVGLLLQGWSFHLAAGKSELILETVNCEAHAAEVGDYEREDLTTSARGVTVILHGGETIDPRSVRRVYFGAAGGLYFLDLFENRSILDQAQAVAHVRTMLPQLRLEAGIAKSFRRVCNSRYEGQETVSQLPLPLRAALDLAVQVPESGLFLAGWLLDPTGLVRTATLRNGAGFAARFDQTWHRVMRPDVSQSYAVEPLFQDRLRSGDHAHGWFAYIPCGAEAMQLEGFYIELELEHEEFAFLPVQVNEIASTATVRSILSSFNARDPAAENIVARHVGPIVTAAVKRLPAAAIGAAMTEFGRPVRQPAVSAILPVLQPRLDLDINFAKLATDPDFESAELLVVAPLPLSDQLGPLLRQYADFYGLAGRLLLVPGGVDRFEMLEVGARLAVADLLLLLSPSVLPTRAGWIGGLIDSLRYSRKAGIVSPTLIYEDYSVRFAGGGGETGLAVRSLARPQFAGYARHWLHQRGVTVASAATTDCCLLRRQLFGDVGGFSKDFVGPDLKDLDLSLKIRAAGLDCLWASNLELFAVDEPSFETPNRSWQETGQLVDRWGFNRKWSRFFADAGGVQ